jgi:hypothetical protein
MTAPYLANMHPQFATWHAKQSDAATADLAAYWASTALMPDICQNDTTGLYARQTRLMQYAQAAYAYSTARPLVVVAATPVISIDAP